MAEGEKIFNLKKFSGLNENADGDTKLSMGEAAEMRNWRVTKDGNLQKRPGSALVETIGTGKVQGMWSGWLGGEEIMLAACDGALYRYDADGEFIPAGMLGTTERVFMFPFAEKVYILTGSSYLSYDGQTLSVVDGYRPMVTVAASPDGGGQVLEQINKLNGKRRCLFSPDGTATVFHLPEKNLSSVDYVQDANGTALTGWTADLVNGTITFSAAPALGVNTIEVGWTVPASFRSQIEGMRYAEIYSGTTDTLVFVYGDGSNKAIYSAIDRDGAARADYFPDLNEMAIGDSNTPITGMIRHFSRLICFKADSTWTIQYSTTSLADGNLTTAFYIAPVNKAIGNSAPGQAQLVLNSPRSLFGGAVYEWKSSNAGGNLTADERQAKRISDRISRTLSEFKTEECICFDDNPQQEYYICYDGRALVHNYAVDAWYYYTGLDIEAMCSFGGETYYGTTHGKIYRFDYDRMTDDGELIDAYWESGAMSFGQDYMRKYSSMLWVGIKPESQGEVTVTVQTDRKSSYTEKVVSADLIDFNRINFANFTFSTNRKPKMHRLKIKAKKFVFYKLIFQNSTNTTATVLSTDIRVRFTGMAK